MARKEDGGNRKGDEQEQTLSRREFLHLAGLAAGGGALLAATSELLSAGVVKGEGSHRH